MLRLHRLPPVLVALVAPAAIVPAAAPASVTLSASPALYPSFQRGVSDYVSRCKPGKPLVLSGNASGGEKVAIGSRPAHSGQFTESVDRKAGGGVTVRVTSPSRPATFHIRCLPTDFPRWDAKRPGKPQAQWYVVTPNGTQHRGYLAVFDSHAVPVWWRYAGSYGPWDAKPMPGGTIAWTHYLGDPFGQPASYGYEEHRLDGTFVRRVRAVGFPTDTHELERMSNGDYLVISYVARTGVNLTAYGGPDNAKVYDGVIQEVTPSGTVAWEWHSNDHFDPADTGRWWPALVHDQNRKTDPSKRYYDLVHLNSVEPDGDGFIVSARHLDAVFRIKKSDGSIDWKLGGTNLPMKSLAVVGDPYGDQPFGGQHDARLWTDGSVTVFDNETLRSHPPRAVRYEINPPFATLKEDVRDSRAKESVFGGSARKLPGGDWVVYWGGSTLVSEQTDKGKPVFSIAFRDGRWGYRAAVVPSGQLSAKSLRNGMDGVSKAKQAGR